MCAEILSSLFPPSYRDLSDFIGAVRYYLGRNRSMSCLAHPSAVEEQGGQIRGMSSRRCRDTRARCVGWSPGSEVLASGGNDNVAARGVRYVTYIDINHFDTAFSQKLPKTIRGKPVDPNHLVPPSWTFGAVRGVIRDFLRRTVSWKCARQIRITRGRSLVVPASPSQRYLPFSSWGLLVRAGARQSWV